jgi:hypothetical protein
VVVQFFINRIFSGRILFRRLLWLIRRLSRRCGGQHLCRFVREAQLEVWCVILDSLFLPYSLAADAWVGKTDDDFQADETHNESDWWRPSVEVTNAIGLEPQTEEDEAYWLEFPKYGTCSTLIVWLALPLTRAPPCKGILAYTQRYIGQIYAPMDLHHFPFDIQELHIQFESFHWKESDLQLLRLPTVAYQNTPPPGSYWHVLGNDVQLPEWDVTRKHAPDTAYRRSSPANQISLWSSASNTMPSKTAAILRFTSPWA